MVPAVTTRAIIPAAPMDTPSSGYIAGQAVPSAASGSPRLMKDKKIIVNRSLAMEILQVDTD